jgi:Homeodomain-like domain-containing protein
MLQLSHPTVTREAVWAALRHRHGVRLRERYHAVLRLLDGKTCPAIAQCLSRDAETMRLWMHAVNDQGRDGLHRVPLPGRPPYRLRPTVSQGECAMVLRQVARYYQGQQVLLVHDRAAPPWGQGVDTVVQKTQGCLLLPQPRYAPARTPQEHLWKWLRRGCPMSIGLRLSTRHFKRSVTAFVPSLAVRTTSGNFVPSKLRNL